MFKNIPKARHLSLLMSIAYGRVGAGQKVKNSVTSNVHTLINQICPSVNFVPQ